MLLLIEQKLLPKPDVIIFSDTGSELPETEQFVEQIARPFVEDILEIPFFIVNNPDRGALHDYYTKRRTMPMVGQRSCTSQFKILPLRRLVRKIVGNQNGKLLAQMWLGITTDEERRRSNKSDVIWAQPTYPLLDIHRISRKDCMKILKDTDWGVQKSGCFCCPYPGMNYFLKLKNTHPELFDLSVEMERQFLQRSSEEGKHRTIGLANNKQITKLADAGVKFVSLSEWFVGDGEDSSCDSDAGCFI